MRCRAGGCDPDTGELYGCVGRALTRRELKAKHGDASKAERSRLNGLCAACAVFERVLVSAGLGTVGVGAGGTLEDSLHQGEERRDLLAVKIEPGQDHPKRPSEEPDLKLLAEAGAAMWLRRITDPEDQMILRAVVRENRTVARVVVDGRDVGHALVMAGLAWHWPKYSGNDSALAAAEAQAKSAGRSIWSLPNPLPPWEVRAMRATGREPSRTQALPGEEALIYHGNTNSRIFHAPWCRYYTCKNCTRLFPSREEAIRAGYRPGKVCKA